MESGQSGSTARVVKRKTRTRMSVHAASICPSACAAFAQVCPVVRTESLMGERSAATERSLQVYDSHHDRITQLVIHQQPESQELLPSPHSLRPNPAEGEGLASHSCEAGLWQCHPHIALYHTTTCQQLPTLQREALQRRSTPFNGLGSHKSLGGG